MYCKACGKQILDDSLFCNKCGAPQRDESGLSHAEVRWETCMIRARLLASRFFGGSEWEFWAEATGPPGIYQAASLQFKAPEDFNDSQPYPRQNESAKQALSNFVSQLSQEGWESIGIGGDYWYQYKFRRRVK